jgi:hypothetical protein
MEDPAQMTCRPLQTGQISCHDSAGGLIDCIGTGQDAEFRHGLPWPAPRFIAHDQVVADQLTGLLWTRKANFADFPLSWNEALAFVRAMNRETVLGFDDWRLPNRNELHSLVSYQTRKPALPHPHPFTEVFLGWYWSSTTVAGRPAHAWYLHLEGARLFFGGKDQSFLVWPVRGRGNRVLAATGQTCCYDEQGARLPCAASGQDGEYRYGRPWPSPRFQRQGDAVIDRLTGLCWHGLADLTHGPVPWQDALDAITALNQGVNVHWRLPNINELASLVDASRCDPALPASAPFTAVRSDYWSATTSLFEPDWAWALYLQQGALGIGQKSGSHFHVWPVRCAER